MEFRADFIHGHGQYFDRTLAICLLIVHVKHLLCCSLEAATSNQHHVLCFCGDYSNLRFAINMVRGGSRIFGKGVHMYKGVGVRFADFITFFLNIP